METPCQTCLGHLDNPVDLFKSSHNDLLDVLQRLLTFQVFIEGNEFNVCGNCQQSLVSIYEFQKICLKSLKSLRDEYIRIEPIDESFIDSDFDKKQANEDNIKNEGGTRRSKRLRLRGDKDLQSKRSKLWDTNLEGAPKDPNRNELACKFCKKRFKFIKSLRRHFTLAHIDSRSTIATDTKTIDQDKNSSRSEDSDMLDIAKKKLPEILDEKKTVVDLREDESSRIQGIVPYRVPRVPLTDVLKAIKDLDDAKTDRSSRTCIFCQFVGPNNIVLRNHMKKSHKDDKKNWCANCNLNAEDLQEHKDAVGCDVSTCKFCKKDFMRLKALRKHLRAHGRIGSATIPSKVHDNALRRYKQHPRAKVLQIIDDFKTKRKICIHCGYSAPSTRILVNHMRDSHGLHVNNWCVHCNVQTEDLQNHVDSTGCLDYPCVFCKRKCIQPGRLLEHLRKHSASITKTSKTVESTEMYIDSNNSSDYCPFCKKDFKDITIHMTQTHAWTNSTDKDHYRQKEHLCQLCGKILQSANRLKYHMMAIHSTKKSFECTTCGKCYSSEYILEQHSKQLHNGPYVCDICGKLSSALIYHRKHKAIHAKKDDMPYKCNICSYTTVQSFSLTKHMKQHPEDVPQASNPHKCPHCCRSYSTNAVLSSHIRLNHSKKSSSVSKKNSK